MSIVFSVITPSYNHAQFVSETLNSILSQSGNFYIDLIIMDGASNDGTAEIIHSKFKEITSLKIVLEKAGLIFYKGPGVSCSGVSIRWKSEKDSGQAEAINKGFKLAQGDYVCWLNSDDLYASSETLKIVTDFFIQNSEAKFVYGLGYTLNREGDIIGEESYIVDSSLENIKEIDYILQPSAFWRKEIYEEIGLLDEKYHFVLDWDYWVRISQKHKLYFLNKFLSCNRIYDETKTSSGHMKRYLEIVNFLVKNNSLTQKSLTSYVILPEVKKELSSYNIIVRYALIFNKMLKEEGLSQTLKFCAGKCIRVIQKFVK